MSEQLNEAAMELERPTHVREEQGFAGCVTDVEVMRMRSGWNASFTCGDWFSARVSAHPSNVAFRGDGQCEERHASSTCCEVCSLGVLAHLSTLVSRGDGQCEFRFLFGVRVARRQMSGVERTTCVVGWWRPNSLSIASLNGWHAR